MPQKWQWFVVDLVVVAVEGRHCGGGGGSAMLFFFSFLFFLNIGRAYTTLYLVIVDKQSSTSKTRIPHFVQKTIATFTERKTRFRPNNPTLLLENYSN